MTVVINSNEQASTSSSTTPFPPHVHDTPGEYQTQDNASQASCFILPEQLDYSVTSYLDPAEGECVIPSSPCRCGTWYFPSLPPSLGGCGHIYRVQPYVCTLHPYPQSCPGVDWTRKVRSSYYVLGLCPACKHIPSKMAKYKKQIDDLERPELIEQTLTLLLAAQDFFEEERKKEAELRRQRQNTRL